MKKLLVTLIAVLSFTPWGLSQNSHFTRIYDFKGNDFDYGVVGMVGTNDSLYLLSNTPDGRGIFFRIDGNGNGYTVIWKFDQVNYAPGSLLTDGNAIYGTTRFSATGGGALFRYSLKDHEFAFIKYFNSADVVDIQVKQIAGDVLWLCSQGSPDDYGSICTIKNDGTQFKKIYNDMNAAKGQNPADFVLYGDDIYIACYGGGALVPDGTWSFESAGCFIRIKTDGTGYRKILNGGDEGKGTQPQSLIVRNNKIFGLYAYSGNNLPLGARFFRCNLDGSSYQALGTLNSRSLTRMLSTDSLIYGISFNQVFGINPLTGEFRIFDDSRSNPDFGYDMTATPVLLNGSIYMATQQGGPNGGGTILKWTNAAPEVINLPSDSISSTSEISLDGLFTDPEGDSLNYSFDYDSTAVEVHEKSAKITITPLQPGETEVKITANDGWGGHKTYSQKINSPIKTRTKTLVDTSYPDIYPNPANSVLFLGSDDTESAEILTLSGKLVKSYRNPGNKIDISALKNGTYLIRCQTNGVSCTQKLIKY